MNLSNTWYCHDAEDTGATGRSDGSLPFLTGVFGFGEGADVSRLSNDGSSPPTRLTNTPERTVLVVYAREW